MRTQRSETRHPTGARITLAFLLAVCGAALSGCGDGNDGDEGVAPTDFEVPDVEQEGEQEGEERGEEEGEQEEQEQEQQRPPLEDDVLPRADVREVETVYPYRPDGTYAAVLADCALIEEVDEGCPLETLPFIGQETDAPTIEDVMGRVLVTHDWMGERFETLLENDPSGLLLPLFGSTTSIVIGSTVRPSFYWGGTGGIQLDPDYLWLTVAEKQNISIAEDFRSDFGSELGFFFLSSDLIDGERASRFFSLEDRSERTLEDMLVPVMSLLFHELAHANDFLPPGAAAMLDPSMAPADALGSVNETWLSPQLYADLALNSETLFSLAQVRFRGEEASEADKAVTPDVAGAEMGGEGAATFYSYSTIREDFANLLEIALMKRAFDVDVAVGFTDKPANLESFGCEELLVGWGMRNRLGDPNVLPRAEWVADRILGPGALPADFFTRQAGTTTPMTTGVDWCTNRDSAGAQAKATRGDGTATDIAAEMAAAHASRRPDIAFGRRNPLFR